MKDKKKFDIIFKHFAKPISEMRMTYQSSALTIDNHVVSKKVSKAFDTLYEALSEQLDNYRE